MKGNSFLRPRALSEEETIRPWPSGSSLLRSTLLALAAIVIFAVPSSAQYIYVDTNNDGINDSGDVLTTTGPTTVDIYLNVGTNRDGSPASCNNGFMSYELVLSTVNGTVSWGTYTDYTGFSMTASPTTSTTDYHIAFATTGITPIPSPGKIGSLTVEILSGTPCVTIRAGSDLSDVFSTNFGSCCLGVGGNNTLALGSDWFDVGGTALCQSVAPGSVAGLVTANCPTAGTGLLGVIVDAFAVGSGILAGSVVTDATGAFTITPLPPGDYVITIVTPLGYSIALEELPVSVASGGTTSASFALTCNAIVASPRTIGYWKHQAGVAGSGSAKVQVAPALLCAYLDLVQNHFNSNAINPVVIYQPPPDATCEEKIATAATILDVQGVSGKLGQARQQLLAVLLNVAAGYISPTEGISKDGATVSQAITYCDNIIDDPNGDFEKALRIADAINKGNLVEAGEIPLNTVQIAYRRAEPWMAFRATPSSDDGDWTFRFAVPARQRVSLRVYNVAGQHLATVIDQSLSPGSYVVRWDGRANGGARVSRGLYLARLVTPTGAATLKLPRLHR